MPKLEKKDFITIRVWQSNIGKMNIGHASIETYIDNPLNPSEGIHMNYIPSEQELTYFQFFQVTKVSKKGYTPYDMRKEFYKENPADIVISIPIGYEAVKKINSAYNLFQSNKHYWSSMPSLSNFSSTVYSTISGDQPAHYASSTQLVSMLLLASGVAIPALALTADIEKNRSNFKAALTEIAFNVLWYSVKCKLLAAVRADARFALALPILEPWINQNPPPAVPPQNQNVEIALKNIKEKVTEVKKLLKNDGNSGAPLPTENDLTIKSNMSEYLSVVKKFLDESIVKVDAIKIDSVTAEDLIKNNDDAKKQIREALSALNQITDQAAALIKNISPTALNSLMTSTGNLISCCIGILPSQIESVALAMKKHYEKELSECNLVDLGVAVNSDNTPSVSSSYCSLM